MNKLLTQALAFFITSLTLFTSQAQELKGNALQGERLTAMCVGCHGINGYHTGYPEVHRVPKISGQNAKYITAALQAYKSGERKHPSMQGIAQSLSAQEVADLSAYYESTGSLSGSTPLSASNIAKAQALIEKGGCQACHGANFNKPVDPAYPKVAGQYEDYLYVALKSYKTDKKPQIGRSNAIMGGVVKQFSDPELALIAKYVSSLQSELVTIQPSRFR